MAAQSSASLYITSSRFPAEEREALVAFLAYNPKAGDVVIGTGGIRKVRWARESEGKSGGFRVIYFYHSNEIPLFALNVFAKNEKANLTQAEKMN